MVLLTANMTIATMATVPAIERSRIADRPTMTTNTIGSRVSRSSWVAWENAWFCTTKPVV